MEIFITILAISVVILAVVTAVNSMKLQELEEENYNAEKRAVLHFRKLNKIESILKNADMHKENYFVTLDKIKEVITTANVK